MRPAGRPAQMRLLDPGDVNRDHRRKGERHQHGLAGGDVRRRPRGILTDRGPSHKANAPHRFPGGNAAPFRIPATNRPGYATNGDHSGTGVNLIKK